MGSSKRPISIVTGGAGFIGSHLVEWLLGEGHIVIVIDNYITGSPVNLKHLSRNASLEVINQDISNCTLNISSKVDYIWHLASPASPRDYLQHPIETLKVGAYGTINVLELARFHNAKFLLASTSEVYGDPLIHPQTETYWGNVNPIGPRSCYDESKRFAEAITMAYHRKYGIETRIVRIFNTYGPRMRVDDGRVVPTFIGQALKGEDLTIFGDGNQTRSFCYISDLIEGIVKAMHFGDPFPINLGNPEEVTIKELADYIIRLTGANSRLVYRQLPQDDPKKRCPDITRARNLLKWEPKVNLAQGLKLTIEWFKLNSDIIIKQMQKN